MSRNVYLETIPWQDAYFKLERALDKEGFWALAGAEEADPRDALGRVLAAPVYAGVSSPHYHAAAMDGIAVRARDTSGATPSSPLRLRLGHGAVYVNTGNPVLPPYDAVIMIEDVHEVDGEFVEIISPASPWQHVRLIGEDIVATEMVLPEGHVLRPIDLGAILAAGVTRVLVKKKPVVAIIPSGSELAEPGKALAPGQVPEFNSAVLAAYVTEWGGVPRVMPPVRDDREQIRMRVAEAVAQCDIVVVNAGSSAGTEDHTAEAFGDLGCVIVHGVAIKPGKPVILGYASGKCLMGIPGYPVSAALTASLFLKPVIYRFLGIPEPKTQMVQAVLSRRVVSSLGVEEVVRVKLGEVGGRLVAVPIARGAGLVTSMVRADGLLRIARLSEGVQEGTEVSIELLRPLQEIKDTVVVVGSHDMTLDLLASLMKRYYIGSGLSSAHVGSLGGLLAIRKGEAHAAGVHLLDEDTGEYNISWIRRILRGKKVVLIKLFGRTQGLIVQKQNPKGIRNFDDLLRQDVVFVNRQRGAGTRVLLDYHLKRLGLDSSRIKGYDREEFTHMAVAAAVASGEADAGLGILAAARALDLGFIPLADEDYDLVVPRDIYEEPKVQKMLETIRREEFKRAVLALGGYALNRLGEEMVIDTEGDG